jgi:hypothetical protein
MMSASLTVVTNEQPEMDDDELLAIIEEEIRCSVSFDNDPDEDSREKALDYVQGDMGSDVPHVDGWSAVDSRLVQETIDLALPGIMRVFDAPDMVQYLPNRPGDEEGALQASDYLNYLWENELDGYTVLYTAVHDALSVRNGIIKHWWDPTPEYCMEEMYGLDTEQWDLVSNDPDVAIVAAQTREVSLGMDPATGQPLSISVFDVRVRRVAKGGRLCVENVPPEDFGVSPEARRNLRKARCIWQRYVKTRSDLVREGFDRDMVDEIPGGVSWSWARESRRNDAGSGNITSLSYGTGPLEEVELYEVYVLADINDDGIAERLKCIVAGGPGGRKLLEKEEWAEEDVPFTDITALPRPHRWMGRSLADSTMDLQRIATVLFRQMIDNLMQVNRPMREVVEKNIVLPSELLRPKPSQNVRVREAGSIRNLEVPYIGDKALMGLQYVERLTTKRSGIGEATAALDETAVDPQTATAEQIKHDANYARTELMVRTMAKMGLKNLFANLLRLIVRHQDRPRVIRLNDTWKNFDPRPWNALMDTKIKVGLGTGSRERDLAMMRVIAEDQDKVVAALGADNPIVPPSKWVGTRHSMVRAAGLDEPTRYYADIKDEQFAQWQQQKAENAPPSPAMQAVQAKAQAAQQATQAKIADGQARMQLSAQQVADQQMLAQQKAVADHELERQKMENDLYLKQQEMQAEAQLKGMQILAKQQQSGATAIPEPNNG